MAGEVGGEDALPPPPQAVSKTHSIRTKTNFMTHRPISEGEKLTGKRVGK